jgi:hypothetical protein
MQHHEYVEGCLNEAQMADFCWEMNLPHEYQQKMLAHVRSCLLCQQARP